MNTEDFVTYEQAIALKKLGFDEYCDYIFTSQGKICTKVILSFDYTKREGYVDAPTLSQAQKWLREKGIHVSVNPYRGYDVDADGKLYNVHLLWGFELMDMENVDFMDDAGGNHTSYESALSAGIEKALELLTDKLNSK